jgi:uncharacterized protein YheU (UPF0270 family)
MIIPHEQLEPETLRIVLEEYVTRDGTEMSDPDKKVAQVLRQLEDGEVVVCFDEEAGTCNVLPVGEAMGLEAEPGDHEDPGGFDGQVSGMDEL